MKHTLKRKGFTLIELLVVMSIIALLLSILMPALGRARAEALLTKDQTQVKAVFSGFHSGHHLMRANTHFQALKHAELVVLARLLKAVDQKI